MLGCDRRNHRDGYGALRDRRAPVFYWLYAAHTARVSALWLLPVWLLVEALQWASAVTAASLTALRSPDFYREPYSPGCSPADSSKFGHILEEQVALPAERMSTLLTEALQAAAKLDTRRAARAYSELLQEDPINTELATAYFNMALLGRDKETLADAALRALWIRTRHARTELRAVYSQMSQPNVLAALPVDEPLRLARRLVATREDAAALRVLDGLLGADTTRNLYGRQLADCLLGLFTTYSRHGLRQQADHVRQRLSEHFPSPQTLGGLAPNKEPPLTIRGATTRGARVGNPGTVPASDLELDLDTRLHTRFGHE